VYLGAKRRYINTLPFPSYCRFIATLSFGEHDVVGQTLAGPLIVGDTVASWTDALEAASRVETLVTAAAAIFTRTLVHICRTPHAHPPHTHPYRWQTHGTTLSFARAPGRLPSYHTCTRKTVQLKAKFHYAIWIVPTSNQLRTSSEPAPNQIA